jgi:DNA-binding NtrC family response regulator
MAHRILIVDDEQEILAALDTHLSLIGFEVKTCDNPNVAYDLIMIEKFHIVMLDINMPGMTGIELLRKIKAAKPSVQVLMITAYSTLEKAIDCWEAGASDYILKPFADLDAIGSIVNLTSERIKRWEDAAKRSIRK